MDTQQPSLLVKIFGDTPFEAVVNSVLIVIILIVLWRIVIKPIVTIAINVYALIKENKLAALEIIPPKRSEVSPSSTQDLISILQQQLGKHAYESNGTWAFDFNGWSSEKTCWKLIKRLQKMDIQTGTMSASL